MSLEESAHLAQSQLQPAGCSQSQEQSLTAFLFKKSPPSGPNLLGADEFLPGIPAAT